MAVQADINVPRKSHLIAAFLFFEYNLLYHNSK
jgi:hypothetical protein